MKTPLTYYGGKQQLAAAILKLIPEHKMYVEPFIGPGRPGRLPARSPHRPGRAQLRHPVPLE